MDESSDSIRILVDLLLDRKRPEKELGQHFLLDEGVLKRAIELAEVGVNSHVLEVGAGPGTLTKRLLDSGARVTAIEYDEIACDHLRRVFAEQLESGLLDLIEGDALIVDWPNDITNVVSNPPYQISSPLIERIDRWRVRVGKNENIGLSSVVLLVQEEFAVKMAMSEGPASRGPLGLQTAFHWQCELDAKVPPHAFSPHPRVHSRLVRLKPRELAAENAIEINSKLARKVVELAFEERRKKIRNRLSKTPRKIERISGWHKRRWRDSVALVMKQEIVDGIAEGWQDMRPEELTPIEWLRLVALIESAPLENG